MPWAGPDQHMTGHGQQAAPKSASLGQRRSVRNALTPTSTIPDRSDVDEDELGAYVLALEHTIGPVVATGGRSDSSGIEDDPARITGAKSKRSPSQGASVPPLPLAGEPEAADDEDFDGHGAGLDEEPGNEFTPPRAALPGSDHDDLEEVEMYDPAHEDQEDDMADQQFEALAAACALEADARINGPDAAAQPPVDMSGTPVLQAAPPAGDVTVYAVDKEPAGGDDGFHTAHDLYDIQQERIHQLQAELKRLQDRQLVTTSPHIQNTVQHPQAPPSVVDPATGQAAPPEPVRMEYNFFNAPKEYNVDNMQRHDHQDDPARPREAMVKQVLLRRLAVRAAPHGAVPISDIRGHRPPVYGRAQAAFFVFFIAAVMFFWEGV